MNKTKKCFSNCRNFAKSECNPPRCKYINGEKLKYCRLSYRYKMNKNTCNITRRIKKKDIVNKSEKTIANFIRKTGLFLKIICSDSGQCISFGKNIEEINNFFKGFVNFEYAISPIKKIGAVSANGFVKEIHYEKQGYNAYAILKSSQTKNADNLVYEYLVGEKYVNRIMKKYPCFLQTYGYYYYNSEDTWKNIKQTKPLSNDILQNLLLQNTIDYKDACQKSKLACLLLQHIKSAKSIQDYLHVDSYTHFITFDLIYVLFIVYHCLSSLSKTFTHYDLHDGNVLLYEPIKNKFVQYHYHSKNNTVFTFNSPYIPKIIDYGRSYFDNANVSSKTIYNKLCNTKACGKCGDNVGFGWLDPNPLYHISSTTKNESHDLRLLNVIKNSLPLINESIPKYKSFTELQTILNKVKYGIGISNRGEKIYGTIENTTNGKNVNKIFNVNDAYESLKAAIEMPSLVSLNKTMYVDKNKIGNLHIYEDGRDMHYEA
jgi:hypothetical protein